LVAIFLDCAEVLVAIFLDCAEVLIAILLDCAEVLVAILLGGEAIGIGNHFEGWVVLAERLKCWKSTCLNECLVFGEKEKLA
jgi:hypothetical protein